MRLRVDDGWRPVYELLALDWIDEGCVVGDRCTARPAEAIARIREIVAGRAEALDAPEPDAESGGQQGTG